MGDLDEFTSCHRVTLRPISTYDDDDYDDCACAVVRKSTIATSGHILLVTGQ